MDRIVFRPATIGSGSFPKVKHCIPCPKARTSSKSFIVVVCLFVCLSFSLSVVAQTKKKYWNNYTAHPKWVCTVWAKVLVKSDRINSLSEN